MKQLANEFLKPIFVMGCQRSGTTMIASQLGAPTNSLALPELPFIINLMKDELNNSPANKSYVNLVTHRKFNTLEIEITKQEFTSTWSTIGAIGIIELIINKYLEIKKVKLPKDETINWIEHCPTNIDNFYILRQFFPNAKFIHIVRDPRAVYASMKHLIRWEFSDPIKLSMFWLKAVSKGYLLHKTFPDSVIQINYEEYVQDENVLKELCKFLDIEFSTEMCKGGGVILPSFTQKQHKLTMGKTSTAKIDSWKNKITKKEQNAINFFCAEWMIEHSYLTEEKLHSSPSAMDKRLWRLRSTFLNARAKVVNKLVLKGIMKA